ncbi:taurine ABC transporter substrate-binding protein [Rubrivivax gelatinosus]|uniref:Taurine ABC transporter substrate binding protein TauA n=1 Tax=Rubrivivax gelatinosus (strain NBRC 100245 / IL144) TaxID=983917 RepID=I0HS86_RUBGI|nr:taurine ABC transporter substrate-binding protein [Rubrivivax gelatinosus]MBG6082402.1 taurine transport system substrate-binding protein [Rubrivivax gelatinosus]BAL95873.1 taurine ABC transporter substrate binding protein TauA [Rubrivivax gelatinosus IL144]
MKLTRRALATAALAALACTPAAWAADTVTIAYQTGVDPSKVAQADGAYEKATGARIDWRKFDAGAEVITAVASGDVQIGYVGSSPIAAAASRGVPAQTFLVAAQLGASEALVVRNGSGITKPADLAGKKVAVPFVSTGHYSLLAALKHWKIDPSKVQILNLRPPEITAAWQRGDIDATYVWDPALGNAKASGKVLATSADLAKWGAPTFDGWIVRKDFAEKNPEFVARFARVTLDAYAAFRADPKGWIAKSEHIDKIARITGAKKEDIPGLLEGNVFPTAKEQQALLASSTAKALAATSAFLKEQGKVDSVQPDYAPFVTAAFVK